MSVHLAALIWIALAVPLRSEVPWSVARDGNIEVYSHHSAADARAALLWLEQLRALVKVVRMVLRQGLRLGLAGVAVGMAGAFYACRALIYSIGLFNFRRVDPLILIAIPLICY